MPDDRPKLGKWMARQRSSLLVQYIGAVLAAWLAVSLWALIPALHRDPFALFLAAVVVTARFFGFGPALFCSVLSTACLDFVVFAPRFSLTVNPTEDLKRLAAFLAIAVLVGTLARQKTQAELRAERITREMAAIVECSDDAILSTATDGTITSWNRGAQNLYGYTAAEVVGTSIYMLAPPERHEEMKHNLEALSQGGRVEPYETERLRRDGTRFPVLLTIAPLRNAKGEIVGTSGVARDISAKRRSEEAIRRSDKLATAGRLAASIAHEINNPLEAVLNLLYLARHDPAKADQYLGMAEQEVSRVASLAQQTLGFVRDTATPSRMDPATIMDEILQLYSRKLEGRKIRVTRRYRNPCQISGYSGEVRQLLANLLVNAVDAMEVGGALTVRVAAGHRWSDGTEGIRITVADNGRGISRENLRHIFEPFYSTKKDAGTGLGLWVSRGIVHKHGGNIRVRSRSEGHRRGTLFSVFLPNAFQVSRVA